MKCQLRRCIRQLKTLSVRGTLLSQNLDQYYCIWQIVAEGQSGLVASVAQERPAVQHSSNLDEKLQSLLLISGWN